MWGADMDWFIRTLMVLAAVGILAGLAWLVVGVIWLVQHVRVVVL